jgi:UDP-glucose 4-epimerase
MPVQKFVLISSLASYGPGDKTKMNPIQVNDVHRPISEYGKSKSKATQYIRSLTNLPHLVIHPTGVYGPRDKDFFQFIKLVSRGFEPYIGRHKQQLSLIYVKDVAKAVVALLSSSCVNRSYLLSDGNGYDKEQIGIEARRSLRKKTVKIKLPLKLVQMAVSGIDGVHQFLFNRLPFINREKLDEISSANWLCNSNDIWNHINDKPSFDLQQGVTETIEWYKKNNWL